MATQHEASPYLSAIQSLGGDTPGEKYKSLHSVAAQIIANPKELETFTKNGETNHVPSALHETLRILVGLKLKSKGTVVEALKSDDVTIIKLALGAKWFFNPSNELMNVDYISNNLLPFVALRTRLELVKVLSRCLKAPQAESFHRRFTVLFGGDHALPLLVACSEDYIYDEILKCKMVLTDRMLRELYRKYPQLIIRYLRFIKDDSAGKKGRSDVIMDNYQRFLPNLVKNHTKEFVEFYKSITWYLRNIKLGHVRAEFFLKNAVDTLVENPNEFLDCLPLKLVKSKLSKEQYDTMLQNMLPKEINECNVRKMCEYVQKYYPKEGGFELFREKYKKAYGKDLLEQKDILEDDEIYKILPEDIKAEYSRKYVNSFTDKTKYWKRVYQLPPKEAIPLLKEQINKSTVLSREDCLKYMLRSCDLYNSKEDLLEVLKYYSTRHKNEQDSVLLQWLECLTGTFDNLASLEKEHWQVMKDIVQRAYIKGDIFSSSYYFNLSGLFTPMLRHYLKQCQSGQADDADKAFLDKVVNIILEGYLEHGKKWDFLANLPPGSEEVALEKFLVTVPLKYPEDHQAWKKDKNKVQLACYFVEAMHEYNEKMLRTPLDPKVKATKMLVEYYPWLASIVEELFHYEEVNSSRERNWASKKYLLQMHLPEFYQNLIDESSDSIYDVTMYDALRVLKREPRKILMKIDKYVEDCRNKIDKRPTRRFIMSLKWYKDIPLKFVEKCKAEIEEKGSIVILGILLEGRVLSKIVEPYLPKEKQLEVDSENAKKDYELISSIPRALNYANPPPALEVLIPLCKGDYLSVALQTLSSIAQRVPVDKVLSFADHLTNNAISVRKAGIRLVFQVSTKPQAREFLTKVCKEEKNPGIREVVAKMVYEVFTQTPSEDSWQLMKELIKDLVADDKKIFDVLKKVKGISAEYGAEYLLEIFKKIDSFSDEELNRTERSNLIRSFLDEIEDEKVFNKLPEDRITDIVTKYLLECTMEFILDMYLFSDEVKFEGRLKVMMEVLSESLKRIGEPQSNKPRFYPGLKKFHDRFANYSLFSHLEDNKNKDMNRRLIASVLKNVGVRKDLDCFIYFNIYQAYFEASDANSFGEKCGKNIDDVIQIYKNSVIIQRYGERLESVVSRSPYRDQQLDVIDGLMSHKFEYGVLVGLKLLSTWSVSSYDERYDKFVQVAKSSDDVLVQATLYNFLAEIYDYDADNDCDNGECCNVID